MNSQAAEKPKWKLAAFEAAMYLKEHQYKETMEEPGAFNPSSEDQQVVNDTHHEDAPLSP